LLAFCLLGTVALLLWPLMIEPLQSLCVATNLVAESRCATSPGRLLGYIAMIAAFPAILILEKLWPAAKSQNLFSVGLLVDFIFFCFSPIIFIAIIVPIEDVLGSLYRYLGFGKVIFLGSLPTAVQIAIVFVLSDFLGWLAHVIRHKSAFVWEFHKIHHSQEELNYFSTVRLHPVDEIAVLLVRFLPFALLDANVAVPAFALVTSLSRVYTMFTHSNIRTNLGPLKYILVTPQSHRVHHSNRPEHADRNFANVFAFWDFIFGTQVLDFDTYPETGVQDPNVPRPARPSLRDAVTAFGKMLLYPFHSLRHRAN
jgi:sterol desaturase/sphingolipid hydroxylase (fatty acid hydroxylase superfamily)